MSRKKLIKLLIFLMLFIFSLDFVGRTFYWYFTMWYFDIITHFLGGLWVGLFFLYLFIREDRTASIPRVLFGVLFIGILWEVFEYMVFQRIGAVPFDAFDTGLDLVVDMAGGSTAVFYVLGKVFSKS